MKIGTKVRILEKWGVETYVYKGLAEGVHDSHYFETEDGMESTAMSSETIRSLEKDPLYLVNRRES